MPVDVLMPQLSDEAAEGIVVTWFVDPGDEVSEGDLLVEIQVEKVSVDVEAPATGRLAEVLVPANDAAAQGAVLARIATADDDAGGARPPAAPTATTSTPSAPAPQRAPTSPAARRLARELGVDLDAVTGSGPGGRIVEGDVRAAAAAPAATGGEPLSPMRRQIADRMRRSLSETAQLTLTAEADVTDLAAALDRVSGDGERRSYTEAVVAASAAALRRHPRVAARLVDGALAAADAIDIGVAVALDDGLIVPIVRAADTKDVPTIGREVADLAERARTGALTAPETTGGVFSVTNLGGHGIDAFTPILNPPQTAMVGMGTARERPAVVDGQVVPRRLMVLSLTFDHQVVDGAPAAAFLTDVVGLLETPADLPGLDSTPTEGDPG